MEKDNLLVLIVALVAIVGIVALVLSVGRTGSGSINLPSISATGDAAACGSMIKAFDKCQAISPGSWVTDCKSEGKEMNTACGGVWSNW